MNFSCLFLYSQHLQNSDLGTQLLEILIPTTFLSRSTMYTSAMPLKLFFHEDIWLLTSQKTQNWKFFKESFACSKRNFLETACPNNNARALAKSLYPSIQDLEDIGDSSCSTEFLCGYYVTIIRKKNSTRLLHHIFND